MEWHDMYQLASNPEDISAAMKALESLKETIRVSNINRDSMPEAPEAKAEDILATILAPNIKK